MGFNCGRTHVEHVHACACAGEAEEENPIKVRRTCDMINDSGQFSPSAPRQTRLQIQICSSSAGGVFSLTHPRILLSLWGPSGPNPPADPDLNPHRMLISPPRQRCGIRLLQRRRDPDVPPLCGRHPRTTLTRLKGNGGTNLGHD